MALKKITGWITFTVSVLNTFFAQNCKTQKKNMGLTIYAGSARDALRISEYSQKIKRISELSPVKKRRIRELSHGTLNN